MDLTYNDVADIIKIIDASSCSEVIIELGNTKIVVRRSMESMPSVENVSSKIQKQVQAAGSTSTADIPEIPATNNAAARPPEVDALLVRAPMTGTFYRAPSPKDPPFVDVGMSVKKGDTLCMIEVMKLFSSILAEIDGVVTRIYPEDGAVVQVDQPLFKVEVT